MGVPFEALLPYGIMMGMFVVSGAGLGQLRYMQNGGKRGRRGLDAWDNQSMTVPRTTSAIPNTCVVVMGRDKRLTGFARGQTDKAEAPAGFELNNPWKVETRFF